MNCFEIIISSITALIAVFAAIIAYQQFHVNKNKFKFDLFEKRFELFLKFREFVLIVIQRGGKIEMDEICQFRYKTLEHKFIFDDELEKYIHVFQEKVDRMKTIEVELINPRDNQEKVKNLEEMKILFTWFNEQYETITERFKKYLSIKDCFSYKKFF